MTGKCFLNRILLVVCHSIAYIANDERSANFISSCVLWKARCNFTDIIKKKIFKICHFISNFHKIITISFNVHEKISSLVSDFFLVFKLLISFKKKKNGKIGSSYTIYNYAVIRNSFQGEEFFCQECVFDYFLVNVKDVSVIYVPLFANIY